jgi:peptide/nickel transport system permease protein
MSVIELEARDVAIETAPSGLWSDAWYRLKRNPGAITGFVIIAFVVVIAIFAPLVAPFGPREQNLAALRGGCCPGPTGEHWFGVDELGRDELSRIIFGARYSLLIGGFVDTLIMRITDIWLTIPGFLMAIGIVAMLGPGLTQIMIAIGVINVPLFARLLRGAVLAQRENDFVLAARSVGVPRYQILGAHILPNAISPVIVQGTLALATAIIDAAGLGFLGLGPQDPSTPEWGTMLTNTVRFLQTAPHLAIIPGVAIVITAISINLIGDGLREALDPKLRGRG